MARSQRKAKGARRGAFRRKRMGKGYSTVRKERIGTRPVLKITEADESAGADKAEENRAEENRAEENRAEENRAEQ